MTSSNNCLKPEVESAEAGNFMDTYPNWLVPKAPLPEGTTSEHHCWDEDDERIEADERKEKRRLRNLKKSIPTL